MQPPVVAMQDSADPLSVLLICTRDPRGRMSGRKMVLWTIIDSLQALGHHVTVTHFGPAEDGLNPPWSSPLNCVALPDPSVFERLRHALRWFFRRDISLNEALYLGRRAEALLRTTAQAVQADIVVTDMLRTAPYGARLGIPWIADLDDLLSRRYRTAAETYSRRANLLGYHRSRLGRVALGLGAWIMPWVLRREAGIIAAREAAVARQANLTTLVSRAEADMLTKTTGIKIRATPMKVVGPAILPKIEGRMKGMVFLGGLDYAPNLRAVVDYDTKVRPLLVSAGIDDVRLHVIGQPTTEAEALSKAIILEGYVVDIDAAIQQFRAMLVPEVPPGGVKTKIIVAALNGTIVFAHRSALEGMSLRDGQNIFGWETAEELALLLRRLHDGSLDVALVAQAARDWAEQYYSAEVLADTWRKNIGDALQLARRPG